ncbi:MAG: hypothetical protein AAF483_03440 [Planctomycetota bacterium]
MSAKSHEIELVVLRKTVHTRRGWCLALLALFATAWSVAATISLTGGYSPTVHDEFSNLLAGDTLLKGRIANEAPEFWEPFQTFHVIMEPSYASKYPLAGGAIVALGRLTVGMPIAGNWFVAGLAAVCFAWMLAGATSRLWAFFGGLIVALHPTLQVVWSQNLFAAWWTAAAACLIAGGMLRLRRRASVPDGCWTGVGIGLIALSRPFEGLVFTCCCFLGLWFFMARRGIHERLNRIATAGMGAAPPMFFCLTLIAWQNYSTTGSVLEMPYQVHEARYGVAPVFIFQQPIESTATNVPAVFSKFHEGWSLDCFRSRQGWTGWVQGISIAVAQIGGLVGLLGIAILYASMSFLKTRVGSFALLALAMQVFAAAAVCWIFPHYLVPAVVWGLFMTVLALRRLAHRFQASRVVVPVGIAVQFALLIVAAWAYCAEPKPEWAQRRVDLLDALSGMRGKHMVVVNYDESHNVHQEWVYNGADLEQAKIIWAHGSNPEWTRKLLENYGTTRTLWHLNPDADFQLELVSTPKKSASAKSVFVHRKVADSTPE